MKKNSGIFRRIRLLCVVIVIFLSLAVPVSAREVQKVGTTSIQTLKISGSVRAIGMGDAYCSVADDIQSTFWNPAGLIHIKANSAVFTHVNMPANIQYNTAAVAKNFDRYGVFGVHLIALNTDDMPVRTIYHPEGTGENFVAYDVIGGVSWAQRLTDRFIFGANLRFVTSGIKDAGANSVLADIGALYETDLRTLKLGFSVQNFGPDINYSGTYVDYLDQGRRDRAVAQTNSYSAAPPPTIYRIGLSADPFAMGGITLPPEWKALLALEMSHPNDSAERINVGAEVTFMGMLAVRGGHKLRYKNQFGYDEERWSGGLGLKIPIGADRQVQLDYAYAGFGLLADAADGFMASPHRFSLTVNF